VSGLCGWIGHGASVADNRGLIEAMAAPLARYDASRVTSAAGSKSAAAVSASAASTHVFQRDGLIVALWGQVRASDALLDAHAQADGLAAALAQAWRRDPGSVCAQLRGAFSLCILDESSGEALLAIDRMGTQPMAYQSVGAALVFGSSADAIVRHPLTPGKLDHQGLFNYVSFHMVPAPGTVYQGQQ
jgi:asparagine synthase (glutamine-hydrolysing)